MKTNSNMENKRCLRINIVKEQRWLLLDGTKTIGVLS